MREFGLCLSQIGLHGIQFSFTSLVVLVVGVAVIGVLGESKLALLKIDFLLPFGDLLFQGFNFRLFLLFCRWVLAWLVGNGGVFGQWCGIRIGTGSSGGGRSRRRGRN